MPGSSSITDRAERAATALPPSTALRKLARLRAKASAEEQIVVDLLAAQMQIALKAYRSANEIIDDVSRRAADLSPGTPLALRTRASLAFVRAMILILTDPVEALALMEEASAVYKALGISWKLGAVECNRAIALVTLGRPDEAMVALDAAVQLSRADAPDSELLGHRLRAIEVNRSAVASQLNMADPISSLLEARTTAVAAADRVNIARIDLGLAQSYLTRERFGSQLRAASSAAAIFDDLGMEQDATVASILVARALVGLGRYHGVEQYLLRLMSTVPDPDSDRPAWWSDASEALGALRRATDPSTAATMKTDLSPLNRHPPIVLLINRMNALLDDAFERVARGEYIQPPPELSEIVTQIRSVRVPEAVRIAEVLELMIVAVSTGTNMPNISDEHDAALRFAGMSREQIVDAVEAAKLIHSSDVTTQLALALGEVADHQLRFAAQESQGDRSELHVSAGRSMATALQLSVITGNPDTTFELLESGRRDLSEWTDSGVEGVMSFDAVLEASGDVLLGRHDSGINPVAVPGLISVRGASALHDVRPRRPVKYEADELRRGLGGDRSVWLSLRVVGPDLVWAHLSGDGASGGSTRIDDDFRFAMARHALAIPVASDIHRRVAGVDAAPWMVHLVAVAVAAAGPLLMRRDVVESCLDALPLAVAKRTRAFLEAQAHDLVTYEYIADRVLPATLKSGLADVDRLLISLPPELSTLPLPILPAEDGRLLGEQVLVTLAPPSSLAHAVVSRPVGSPSGSRLVAVINPTDDLTSATAGGETALAGWARAASADGVATRQNLLDRLEAASAVGDFALSFVGHVRPGLSGRPGRSALVLAPDEPGGDPEHLGAAELRVAAHGARQVYLGGCESAGFGTGYEWASVAGAFLVSGADIVLAHAWPILDSPDASAIDATIVSLLAGESLSGSSLFDLQRQWIDDWRADPSSSVPPHHWAGLSAVGRLPV